MIRYKGKEYSVPTKYIGEYVTVQQTENQLQIYYTKDLIACYRMSKKILHYKINHAKEILRSEALKYYTDEDIRIS